MFRNSLLPYDNTRTLTKSFEKTSAKGGKPLIKTHDKRFLIKEVKKEELEFLMSILPKYHNHLKDYPNSLLAKIVGIYGVKIGDKDKVYHVLMESLDPIDDLFIKFKYDLKFSTVNRREYKNRQEVKCVRDELLEQNPSLDELFPKKKDLNYLGELDKTTNNQGGMKKLASSNGSDNKSREAKSKVGKSKAKSTESGELKNSKGDTKSKTNTNSNSNEQDESEDDDSEDDNRMMADDEDIDDDIENDEKFKQLDYEEQLVYREQKYLYKQQRMWN